MKPQLRPLPLIIATLCAAMGQGVQGETVLKEVVVTEKAAPASHYEATQSSSATKIAVPLRDVPQSVSVVPQAVMRDQNAQSVQDALQNVPGLSFSVGDGQRDQVAIRGFTAITDQFIDGVRAARTATALTPASITAQTLNTIGRSPLL